MPVQEITPGIIPVSTEGVAGAAPGSRTPWLLYQHRDYKARVEQWRYALDHYTGDILLPEKRPRYLIQRRQGETDQAFEERSDLADYTNHFATVVDSLAGMLFNVEANANRVFNDEKNETLGLGSPDDPDTPMGSLWRHADEDGNGWLTFWKALAIELCLLHRAWIMVDSVDGEPNLRLISAPLVPNWRSVSGVLTEALVEEYVDQRGSLRDEPDVVTRYLHLTPQGWQRYALNRQQEILTLTERGDFGTYSFTSPTGQRALPIYCVELPMRRPVGYLMARKANAIFNQESARDHLIRAANFPKLVLMGGDQLLAALEDALKRGSNVLQGSKDHGAHTYISPDASCATVATDVLKRKVEEYYITAYREYGDSAAQRTATEVRQDVSSGAGAFLQLLKAALDDAENNAYWRIEQILHPDDRRYWFQAHVERSDEFLPADPESAIQRLKERVFGVDQTVPVGRTARMEAAKQIVSWAGLPVNEAEIEADVKARAVIDVLKLGIELPMPGRVKGQAVLDLVAANGLIDAEATVEMVDGQQQSLTSQLTKEVMALAEAQDEAARRQAESFTSPGALAQRPGGPQHGGPPRQPPAGGGPAPSADGEEE